MAQTIAIPESKYQKLTQRLERVEKLLSILVAKLEQEPPQNTSA